MACVASPPCLQYRSVSSSCGSLIAALSDGSSAFPLIGYFTGTRTARLHMSASQPTVASVPLSVSLYSSVSRDLRAFIAISRYRPACRPGRDSLHDRVGQAGILFMTVV